MPDIDLIKRELSGIKLVSDIVYFDETGSTNTAAKQLKTDSLVIAEYQSSGKGRFERKWESEKGSNLTFSIRKKIEIPADKISYINFFFSCYIFETIKELIKENGDTSLLTIKWPNDILYNGKKICGILVESNLSKNVFIIGIGININQENFPSHLNAVSLYNITGIKSDISGTLVRLVKKFDHNFPSLQKCEQSLFEKWKNHSLITAKDIIITSEDNKLESAKVLDLQEDGGIKVLLNGKESVFYSGEIKITRIGS